MTLGLYLMTTKGLAVLDAALESGIEIVHVTTAEAKGMDDDSHAIIAARAKGAGIPTFLRAHPPNYAGDWSIAAGWRWLMPVPNLIVLHDSILPRYRGFSPLVTALVNGDPEVGVTAFLAVDEPDAGPIVAQRRIPVSYPAPVRNVIDRLCPEYASLTREILLQLIVDGGITYAAQDHLAATYSVWRDEDDYRIDWTKDDRTIVRLIAATGPPFPGAWTDGINANTGVLPSMVRILDATVERDVRFEQRHPGKVAFERDGCPIVVCGQGMVRVLASSAPIPFRTRLS